MNEAPNTNKTAKSDRNSAKTTRAKRWILIALSLIALTGVLFYLVAAEDTIDVEKAKTAEPLQLVTVETCSVHSETVEITSFAEVRPRWSVELRSAVSGRVLNVQEKSLVGERVDIGTKLISIEQSKYSAELTAAELALKEANLAHWKAKNATMLARKQYQRSGQKPPNDLALHLPELRIAEASVKTAQARLAAAKQQLRDTTITAPFSGFVTDRFVSPGQMINPGDRLVKLVDNSIFELTVELGRRSWELLKKPLAGQKARVLDQAGNEIAEATIRQGGGFLDEKTRQYKVFLEILKASEGPVLSGDFVKVILPGITVPDAFNIPASALTQEGYVWHVDAEDRLQRVTPQVLFRRQDRIIIRAPARAGTWRIATTPLVSFLPGQKVQIKKTED